MNRELVDLVEEALRDPHAIVEKLAPAQAMSRAAVEEVAEWVREAARWARRTRSIDAFPAVLGAMLSSVPLREDVHAEFDRLAREEPSVRSMDLSALRDLTVEVASRYTRLRRCGSRWKGLCPIHRERRPSFYIYPNGTFFCFGCGASGDAADLLSAVEGIPLRDAIRTLLSGG